MHFGMLGHMASDYAVLSICMGTVNTCYTMPFAAIRTYVIQHLAGSFL